MQLWAHSHRLNQCMLTAALNNTAAVRVTTHKAQQMTDAGHSSDSPASLFSL
jgi:hypothetical protein